MKNQFRCSKLLKAAGSPLMIPTIANFFEIPHLQGAANTFPSLCGCCGGAVALIVSIVTHLHRIGFDLEFETFFEPI